MLQHNAPRTHSIHTDMTLQLVSVLVCTCNRYDQVALTIESVLQNNYATFELLIIDQSSDDRTEQVVAMYQHDKRLRYIRTPTRGLGLARSLGIGLADGEIVLMTDDDCVVAGNWISEMVAAHTSYPQAVAVFCDVLPAPHDKTQGFIPSTTIAHDLLMANLYDWCRAGTAQAVLGAGMSVRRSMIEQLGGFDTRLGAGTPLQCAEDTDIAVRALLHGYSVYRTKRVNVIHYGFRNFTETRALMRGYMFGIAAMYGKLLRCGHLQLIPVMLYEILRTLIVPMLQSLGKFQVPPILGRAVALMRGFQAAWKIDLDRSHEVFEPLDSPVIEPNPAPSTESGLSHTKLGIISPQNVSAWFHVLILMLLLCLGCLSWMALFALGAE